MNKKLVLFLTFAVFSLATAAFAQDFELKYIGW